RLSGWPRPVGRLQSRGRHGGGSGTPVYRRDELQVFRELHPQLWPERRRRLVTLAGSDQGELVTLSRFAAIAVNGQLGVPAGGQLKVPAPRGCFSGVWSWCLLVLGFVSCGRSHHW